MHLFFSEPAFLDRDLFLDYRIVRGEDGTEIELESELEWAFTRRIGLVIEAPYGFLNPKEESTENGFGDIAIAPRALLMDTERFLLAAYDFDGTLVWRRILGPFESQHGLGASPIVFEELVIIPNEQVGPSSIIALDRQTGKTVWSTLRKSRILGTSYGTPIIVKSKNDAPQLICCSIAMGVTSLDPYTGTLNWSSGELPARTVASPAYGNGVIIQTCGGGGIGKFMVAVDLTGKGDVSQTHVKYTRNKALPYVPTPIAYNGYLFLWTDQGVAHCVEIETGKTVWANKRVSGALKGSPICVDGKLYAICENGDVVVIDPPARLLAQTVFPVSISTQLTTPWSVHRKR